MTWFVIPAFLLELLEEVYTRTFTMPEMFHGIGHTERKWPAQSHPSKFHIRVNLEIGLTFLVPDCTMLILHSSLRIQWLIDKFFLSLTFLLYLSKSSLVYLLNTILVIEQGNKNHLALTDSTPRVLNLMISECI